jgi:hypothetical protein
MSNQEKYGTIQKVVVKNYYKYCFVLTGGGKDDIYHSNIDIKKLSDFDFDSDSDSDYVYDFNSEIEENRKTYLEEEGGYLTGFHNRDYCDEDCRGWNGFNKRCDCGNRRVYWTDGLCYEAE